MRKIIKITFTILLVVFICSIRFSTSFDMAHFGHWTPPADLEFKRIVVKADGLTRHVIYSGNGEGDIIAYIAEEKIQTSAGLYVPFYQKGKAEGSALVFLKQGDKDLGSFEVGTTSTFTILGILPNLFIRSKIRSNIDQAVRKTVEIRIGESKKRPPLTQGLTTDGH